MTEGCDVLQDDPEEPEDRRKLFWGGQVRAWRYFLGATVAAGQIIARDFDPYAVFVFFLFIVLGWAETCPVCGKTWWSHRSEGFPNLLKMMFVSRRDCPDRKQ